MTPGSAGHPGDMPGPGKVRWYRHGGGRLLATLMISFLSLGTVSLIVYGLGQPVRLAFLVPGVLLTSAVGWLAALPLRAGIGVTPEHILVRAATGRTTRVPWAEVTGFEAGKAGPRSRSDDTVFVLTSDARRLHTLGYDAEGTSPTEAWRLLRALEDERLARAPGTDSTLPSRPPASSDKRNPAVWTWIGAIALIIFGSLPLYSAVAGLGPAIRAARGDGTAGYFTPQRETTGRGATWYGEFRLPDGTVALRNVSIEDLSVSQLQAGVPVAARDSGYSGNVFPRDDPGAWHGPASVLIMACWFYAWALILFIRLGIRRAGRRHLRTGDSD